MTSDPLVTIGVVSYNRLHYLRALVESARRCIEYPNLQWIVVDGNSVEPGLRDYVESLDFLDHAVFADCSHPEAMNTILELTEGDFLLMLPEDVQFIVRGDWLRDFVRVASRPNVGHVQFDAQRRRTLQRHFVETRAVVRGRELHIPIVRRRPRRIVTESGRTFLGYGGRREPVGAAGIVTFVRTEIRRTLGPWRTSGTATSKQDSSLGAEVDMLRRWRASGLALEAYLARIPVAADIVTDPRGTKARIRFGNRRYGRYAPPFDGDLYYRIWEEGDLGRFRDDEPAVAFEDIVEPLGFALPLDEGGNLLKTNVVTDDEPYEIVGPK